MSSLDSLFDDSTDDLRRGDARHIGNGTENARMPEGRLGDERTGRIVEPDEQCGIGLSVVHMLDETFYIQFKVAIQLKQAHRLALTPGTVEKFIKGRHRDREMFHEQAGDGADELARPIGDDHFLMGQPQRAQLPKTKDTSW